MAVFPPIEESTCASKVVGICMKFIPRYKIELAKPTKSPITPPPRAITISLLSMLLSNSSERRI